MTEEENLLRKIQDLQSELENKDIQINAHLDNIDDLEVEVMKYHEMFDENAPKSKIKKAKEEKLNIELNAKDREIRELKDRMGFLRKEKLEIQKKYELEVKKHSDTSVISVEKIREKEKAPLNVLLQELQDKINKQESIIKRLKNKELGSDEYNENLKEKDKKIEMLTDQIADLTENLEKTTSDIELDDKPKINNISKNLLEDLQNNLNKVKRHNDELKKKLRKYEKKGKGKKRSEENSQVLEMQNIISQLNSELEYKNKIIEENTTSSMYRESEASLQQQLRVNQKITADTLPQGDVEGKIKIQRELASFLQQQLAEANNALKTKKEEIITIKTEAIRIKKKYEELENLLKLKDQKTSELYANTEELKMQIRTLNASSREIHPDIKLRLKELQSLVDDLNKQNIQQRLEISQLRKSK